MITQTQEKRIRKLLAEKVSQEQIASHFGTTRHQIRMIKAKTLGTLAINVNGKSKTTDKELDPYRSQMIDWMEMDGLSIFLIHKKLLDKGLTISQSSVQRYIAGLKKSEVYVPVQTLAGEEAQVDYGYLGRFEREGKKVKAWVFCMVLSYSRYAYYGIVTEQSAQSFIHCHQLAFEFFGGSPAKIKIDNLGAGVLEADYYQPVFQQQYFDFLQHYGPTVENARICRGQDKGKVEAGVKYVKHNFLPLHHACDYDQLVAELGLWTKEECNRRVHGTTRKIPADIFLKEEKPQLFCLPKQRFRMTIRESRKIDMYGHLYYRYNFYSVPHHYAGETLSLEIGEKTFQVFHGEVLVTTHVIHPGKGAFLTMNCHKPYFKQAKTDEFYSQEMKAIGESAHRVYELLRACKPYHWKNMVKGILKLTTIYKRAAVEAACLQGMEEGVHDFKHIKQICLQNSAKTKAEPEFKTPKDTNGYHHPLSLYERLINKRKKNPDNHD